MEVLRRISHRVKSLAGVKKSSPSFTTIIMDIKALPVTDKDSSDICIEYAHIRPMDEDGNNAKSKSGTHIVTKEVQLHNEGEDGQRSLALDEDLQWEPGTILKLCFLNGDSDIQNKVKRHALTWQVHANIVFDFNGGLESQIRISFDKNSGSWSLVGTLARDERHKQHEPTICLAIDSADLKYRKERIQRIVLHEFGHVLGLVHEHQSPGLKIRWRKKAVYHDCCKRRRYTREWVDDNIPKAYPKEKARNFSTFDPFSIMVYKIPQHWNRNKIETSWNTSLSEEDKKNIAICYPYDSDYMAISRQLTTLLKSKVTSSSSSIYEQYTRISQGK